MHGTVQIGKSTSPRWYFSCKRQPGVYLDSPASTHAKYLDLTALQPGDVLLTRERTLTSRAIVLAQRFWHFKLFGRGFSHATVVISPLLTFDTRGGTGARFRRLVASQISEDEQGRLRLWLDLSEYEDIAVMRYGNDIDSHLLLRVSAAENTAPYPRVNAFIGLFHPSFKSLWHRIVLRNSPNRNRGTQRFCSALVVYLLQQIETVNHFRQTDWSTISPFKLYDTLYEQGHLLVDRAPHEFSHSELHQSLLHLAQTGAGASYFGDMDQFQHASEDLMIAAAKFLPVQALLRQDADFLINLDGEEISLMDKPHFTQLPFLKEQIDSNAQFLHRLDGMSTCFPGCAKSCRNAASCLKDLDEQLRIIFKAGNA